MPRIMVANSSGKERSIALESDPVGVGRHPDNEVRVVDDRASRFHCVIEPGPIGYIVKDLGSRNGTLVNGQRVSEHSLSDGDVILVGTHRLTVDLSAAGGARPKRRRPSASDTVGPADVFAEAPLEMPTEPVAASPGQPMPAQLPDAPEPLDPFDPLAPPPIDPALGADAQARPRSPFATAGAPSGQRASGQWADGDVPGADWAADLTGRIRELPPPGQDEAPVVLVDADGRPSGSLLSDSDGPRAVRLMLSLAAKARATDIHLEPKGQAVTVRMRIDGQMVAIAQLPNAVAELVNGVVRTACQMKTAARHEVQDGSFSAQHPDCRVDFRASLTPTVHGPKLVLRVLDARSTPQSLRELHMPAYMHEKLQRVCQQDTGLLMVAGPTGSGKTTTLYNALREIDRQARNVVTIEDPVEYHVDGVTQIPVAAKGGFGQLLRSVLRQDPDVILVGEIRDDETARTAMQAAMTGHLVFSTVHAKDTIGAVFRLLDLGVENYLVANSLEVVLAQRLVRVLCPHCKREVRVSPGQASRMGRFIEGKSHTYAATGCPKCLRTGFKGRRALFEMLEFNDELRDIVLGQPTIQALRRVIEQGVFTTLRQAGWLLAARGEVTLEEIDRVTGTG